jgi:flagellar biosynthesis protein FlhA
MGFLPPAVHIRDNLDLPPTRYRILLKGVEIGQGDIQPDRLMAIDPGCAEGDLPGVACTEPTFGLPALWIDEVQRETAQNLGYTVVDPSSVVATHLNHMIATHTEELFGRHEAQQLLDQLTKHSPKLVEDLIPEIISLTLLHKVLQNLLAERVSIRDMRTIIDTLAEFASSTSDPDELTSRVRIRLSRAITQQWFPGEGDIQVIGLDLALEQLLVQATQSGSAIEPGIAENLMKQTEQALLHQESLGAPPVLLVNPSLRLMLSRYLRRQFPQLGVISSQELNTQRNVRMTWIIGSKS